MKQSVKQSAVLTSAGALALASLTDCTSLDNEAVVAKVGKEEIPAGIANFYARMQQAQYETYYASMMGTTGDALWQQEMEEGKTYKESTKETLLLNLENLYLIRQHADEYEDALTEEDKKAIEEAAKSGYEVKTTTFASESSAPNEELVKALDALTTEGDVTDVIESDYGIYVGKLTSLLDREATDAEKTNIIEQRKQEQYDSLLEDWRKETDITENERVWNKIDFEKQGVTVKQSEEKYDDIVDAE